MTYRIALDGIGYEFVNLGQLLAKATPLRSGDQLAGVAAASAWSAWQRSSAFRRCRSAKFLSEPVVPVRRGRRNATHPRHARSRGVCAGRRSDGGSVPGLAAAIRDRWGNPRGAGARAEPEMAAAVSKLMSNQDLILVASKVRVVTRFRNTLGLPGTLSVRLQPNHPTDDPHGVVASIIDGLMYGCGDAVIGINPGIGQPGILRSATAAHRPDGPRI